MALQLAVLSERANGETRIAATPETVRKFIALGADVAVEAGAGLAASIADEAFLAAGARVGPLAEVISGADIVLGVQGPEPALLAGAAPGAWIVAGLDPFGQRERIDAYAAAGFEALAMEFMPRITRAQSMDVLSSQSNLSGYKAVIEAANLYGRAFPLMMYDPRKGERVRERLSLQGNPAVKDDWYVHPKTGEQVTFIDFARSEGRFAKHFDRDGNPSETLLAAKQDRVENWRLLQELAGII